MSRHLMDLSAVHSVPHHVHPALCPHHSEHGHHGIDHVVKVATLVDPFATIVKTVPFRHDFRSGVVWHISHVAKVKRAFK